MTKLADTKTYFFIALISIFLIFYLWGSYRQSLGISYYRDGSGLMRNSDYVKAAALLQKAVFLCPSSSWAADAKNELAFSHIILGESANTESRREIFSRDLLTSGPMLATIFPIIALLIVWIIVHFQQLSKQGKLEEELAYLMKVEHRIRAKAKPSGEGLNRVTGDGVADYMNYIAHFQKSECVFLAKCWLAEFYLDAQPEDMERVNSLEKKYRDFLSSFPNSLFSEEILQKLANLYFFNFSNYIEARKTYQMILEKYPQSKWTKIAQSRINLIDENIDNNGEALRYYVQGEQYYQNKKYQESVAQFEKLIAEFPQSKSAVEAQYNIADIYMFKTEQTGRAISEYQKIIDLHGQTSFAGRSQYKIGECYKKLQKYPEAVAAYEKFIANYPQSEFLDYAYYYIGFCCEQLKDNKKAIETYQHILSNFPSSIWVVVAESRIAALVPK